MIRRQFIPGSEWLYFKIYTGHKTADDILTTVLRPFIEQLYADKLVDNHFFIRYADPDFHLRVRFHIPNVLDYGAVFAGFYKCMQPCMDNLWVSSVMCDTYKREIERYGEDSITCLENLFRVDSVAVVELIARIALSPADKLEVIRWQMALVLLDTMFDAFGFNLSDKARLTGKMAENFKKEFGFVSHSYTKQLNDKYRDVRNDLERFFSSPVLAKLGGDMLATRLTECQKVAEQVIRMQKEGKKVPELDDLLPSLHHMTMNRWFRSRNRQHEMVVYDFLHRYYNSLLAKDKFMR